MFDFGGAHNAWGTGGGLAELSKDKETIGASLNSSEISLFWSTVPGSKAICLGIENRWWGQDIAVTAKR